MSRYPVLVFLVISISLASIASAITCAEKAYTTSCAKCPFDQYGKMDQTCYQGIQNSGVSCLVAAYPLESLEYQTGNCPAIDVCKDRLDECKALYTTGNDKEDCQVDQITHCFYRADNCVAKATQNCSGTPPGDISDIAPPSGWCDGLFFFIFLFVGVVFHNKIDR